MEVPFMGRIVMWLQLVVGMIPCSNGGNATAISGRILLSKKKGGVRYEYS